jgi:alginate O-acetyltransferase complex protein AlgI
LLLPGVAIVFRNWLPAWVFMWLLSGAVFLGCKWLTLRRVATVHPLRANLAYFFAWPGMEADAFLAGAANERPRSGQWVRAGLVTVVGGVFFWLAIHMSPGDNLYFKGWLGMVGVVMTLHFGLFHLMALSWQAVGRDAKPLMRAPLLAVSLADFWGRRWNTAFNALAYGLVFRKLARPCGAAWATLAVFLVSGMVHDAVISLPARGGYGLPTGYFLLQGVGVLFERSETGRAVGLGNGWRGRAFAWLMAAVPAFWLFHPPFILNVIIPMLDTFTAVGKVL